MQEFEITKTVLLDYLYNKFAITFVLCLIGAFIKECAKEYNNPIEKKEKRNVLNMKIVLSSSIFCTFLMCAIAEYANIQFTIYALICVIAGMWSSIIIRAAMNFRFMKTFLINFFKNLGPVFKASSKAIQELENTDDNKDNKKESLRLKEENINNSE